MRLKRAAHTEGLVGGRQFVHGVRGSFTVPICFTVRRDFKGAGRTRRALITIFPLESA